MLAITFHSILWNVIELLPHAIISLLDSPKSLLKLWYGCIITFDYFMRMQLFNQAYYPVLFFVGFCFKKVVNERYLTRIYRRAVGAFDSIVIVSNKHLKNDNLFSHNEIPKSILCLLYWETTRHKLHHNDGLKNTQSLRTFLVLPSHIGACEGVASQTV